MKFLQITDKKGKRIEISVDAIESLTCLDADETCIRTKSGKEYTVAEGTHKIGLKIAHASENTEKLP